MGFQSWILCASMMKFLRKYQMHILAGLLAFFLIYIALGFGTSFFVKGSPNDTLIEVDGENIPLRSYWGQYQRAVSQDKNLDQAGRNQKRDEAIRDLIQQVVFRNQVDLHQIRVPDAQVAMSLAQIPAFQSNGAFNPQLYVQALQTQLKMTPKEFEEQQRTSIGFFKLRWLIQSAVKITDKEMDFSGQYSEFAGDNQFETTDVHDKKTGKVIDRNVRHRTPEEIRELFRKKLWDEKALWSFNQWITQLGQKLRVKTHLDLLDSGGR
jgi:hypothetical protein